MVAEMAAQNARSARPGKCRKCGAAVLTGDDDDHLAWRVTVNAEPVDLVGEMFAVLSGQGTCDLVKTTGRSAKPGQYDLYSRDQWQIHSPHQKGYPIHAHHRCKDAPDDHSMPSVW